MMADHIPLLQFDINLPSDLFDEGRWTELKVKVEGERRR